MSSYVTAATQLRAALCQPVPTTSLSADTSTLSGDAADLSGSNEMLTGSDSVLSTAASTPSNLSGTPADLTGSNEMICVDSGRLVAATVGEALVDLGYDVTRCAGKSAVAFDARYGHEVLLAVVHDELNRIEIDHAGLTDGTCQSRQRALETAIEQRGVILTETEEVAHHDSRGGVLISTAARRGDPVLARAAVAEADANARSARPTTAAAAPSPKRTRARKRLAGGSR